MATDALNYSYPTDDVVVTSPTLHTGRMIRERLIGASGWTEKARVLVSSCAGHNNPVVLEGEPGTGKRSLAELVHRCSPHREGPFVSLKFDSAISEVARSALMGPAREIATEGREKGLIELASGGTLYIEGGPDCLTRRLISALNSATFRGQSYSRSRSIASGEIARGSLPVPSHARLMKWVVNGSISSGLSRSGGISIFSKPPILPAALIGLLVR